MLLGTLGAGGMGVVLSAYDPQLDRRVAVKLLRADLLIGDRGAAGREWLLREAQAMARLNHPNVVTVYEAVLDDNDGYVVMEQVEGKTLRDWLGEAERDWREILAMVAQAGDGLVAAHRAGVVHRDFKPDNVLVGADGRPRVSDFGLALAEDAVAGTRAYMAPEQTAGTAANARSDQYSFCVTLWEALYGSRPRERPEPSRDRKVPGWLQRVLERGLAERPEDRWPSMDALVSALRPRRARSIAIAGALATVAAVGAVAFALGRQGFATNPCTGAEERVAPLWDEPTRAGVAEAFRRTGRPYADDTFARVDASLQRRLAGWARAHRDACEATHVRHEQSESVLDARMRCLGRARGEIGAMVSLLREADTRALDNAAKAAAGAGDVEACADLAALSATTPPPRDAETARHVDELRRELPELAAQRELGHWKEGLAAARRLLERARGIGYAPLVATAALEAARFELDAGDDSVAIDRLYEVARLGSEARDDAVVADATAQLVFALLVRKQRPEAAEVAYRMAEAAMARAGYTPARLSGLLRWQARLANRRGDRTSPVLLSQLVVALEQSIREPESFEVAEALRHLAFNMEELGQYDGARPIRERTVAMMEKVFGPEHPAVAKALESYGSNRANVADFEAAAAALERSLAIQERAVGPTAERIGPVLFALAAARLGQRRLGEARTLIERAIRIKEQRGDGKHPFVAACYDVLGDILQLAGQPEEAHLVAQKALAIRHQALGPNDMRVGFGYERDAAYLLSAGHRAEARAAVDKALDNLRKTVGETHPFFAQALKTQGDVYMAEGQARAAAAVYERSVQIVEKSTGANSPVLCEHLSGLSDALLELGDAQRALAAADRAAALAAKGSPGELEAARFRQVKASWALGDDRARQVARARELRERLGALPFRSEQLPRIDRWLASVARAR